MSIPEEFSRFPDHWDVLPFTKAVKDATSGNIKIQTSDYLEDGLIPIVDQGQLHYGGFTDDKLTICKSELPTIVFGDHTRVFKYIEEPFALGADGAKVLEPLANLDKRFLFHYLKQLKIESAGYSRHYKFLKETYVPVPPLAEQKRIAAILDKADAIRQKRQQAITLADQFLRSVFLDMFGDMFSTIGYQLSHKKKIKQITTYIDYRGKTPEKSDSGIPLITAKNVKVGYISEEPKEFIPADNYTSWMTRGKPESKDVLFTTEAPLGNVALLGTYEKVAIGQRIVALRPKDNIRSEYLMFSLLHPFTQGLIESRSSGSTAKGIRTKELYDIEIPLAELSKQDEFAKIYWYIISMANKISESDTISDTLTNALSSKAFSGQL